MEKALCLVCGAPVAYSEEARELECVLCRKREMGHATCEQGHYVCDACHRAQGTEAILALCRRSDSRNPVELAVEAMREPCVYANGPEHHALAGAVLLSAYRNCGGALDLDKALDELRLRSDHVPGGACGLWGCCGAAVSAGMYLSIVTGSTPMSDEPWAHSTRLTSLVLGRLADLGGPRCCKRGTFAAIETAATCTYELLGVRMELPARISCEFVSGNRECIARRCPYFPCAS